MQKVRQESSSVKRRTAPANEWIIAARACPRSAAMLRRLQRLGAASAASLHIPATSRQFEANDLTATLTAWTSDGVSRLRSLAVRRSADRASAKRQLRFCIVLASSLDQPSIAEARLSSGVAARRPIVLTDGSMTLARSKRGEASRNAIDCSRGNARDQSLSRRRNPPRCGESSDPSSRQIARGSHVPCRR